MVTRLCHKKLLPKPCHQFADLGLDNVKKYRYEKFDLKYTMRFKSYEHFH